jgi:hypothetical protein
MDLNEYDVAQMLSLTKKQVAETYAPVFDLGKEIVLAAVDTLEEVKPFIPGEGTKKVEKQVLVYYQAIWFWAHIATRQVLRNFEKDRFDVATECLSKFISQVAIDSYFQDCSDSQRSVMEAEFLEELNEALGLYSESSNKWKVFGYMGLFVDFTRRIVEQCGLDDQWEHMNVPLASIIERQWKRLSFRMTEIPFYKFVIEEGDSDVSARR